MDRENTAWIESYTNGLNLNEPEDRSVFRCRLDSALAMMKVSAIREHARSLGGDAPNNRAEAVRALANAYISARHGRR